MNDPEIPLPLTESAAETDAAPDSASTPIAEGEVTPIAEGEVTVEGNLPVSEPPAPPERLLPVLPLRNTVLFPGMFMPFAVGRPGSLAAVEVALSGEEKTLLLVAQHPGTAEDAITPEHLYTTATRGVIKRMNRTDEAMELIVQGIERVRISRIDQVEPYLRAAYEVVPLPTDTDTEVEALQRAIIEQANQAMQLVQPQMTVNAQQLLSNATEPIKLVYLLGSMMSLAVEKEQSLLEAASQKDALALLHSYLSHELQVLQLRQKIAAQAQSEMSREQRDYFLRQQLRAIQEELGEKTPEKAEVEALRQRLEEADLPDAVRKEATRDLNRLERLPAMAPDYQVTRTYLELVLELPWKKTTTDQLDLDHARKVLDDDHFGLGEIKERILEHLAVLKLNPHAKAPILCLVGPPGVGKTSLGQSIARALGRVFERMSLGGLHDESELRGHRRTYIGAMPGRIIQAVRRAGVRNPMLLLDELDKLGRDYRGDPAAALLEILDPAQNHTFRDNYLDQPFDLSQIFFIATANTLDTLPRPLLDRMEVLRLSGYSEDEKLQIANRYLLPRAKSETGLANAEIRVPESTLRAVIAGYTREAGCRQLERAMLRMMRKLALGVAKDDQPAATEVTPAMLTELLGPPMFVPDERPSTLPPGVSTGLAWTESGGDVLTIEATRLPGGRGLRITGQIGKVMRESVKAAQSYVWSHAESLGIPPERFRDSGLHVHVPAGAVPKDGPSAGVALVSALTSLYRNVPLRRDTAMTGEITLSGLVLPIGGVKEKVLAAKRLGLGRVILPKANEKDLRDVPEAVRESLEIILADHLRDVLTAAFPPQ
ncbi:endopeptidase La [Tuwongella immobilis]|uniref:Lon protease n=1 Tax=Tuwongella immobilis TaxID=692036 RepID=A0A6C2YLK3_9BACT|nr:endopeptidase La [Tuwongella immobilis]VIP02306.1 atp-dependent protease la : Lon protease OS=uncultured Acidobacteria bacterium GN=lon PE=2 SV=1: LON: AAA: Lon_C [Tuwongella immobilis]VTS01004.1 atp-dependent protease la : Lon protease OS=uncultured Acidobacteria bacterium GN=lon PE=2 SV=1: LON: AAA: Lon_C [Tuwongella immobilis]